MINISKSEGNPIRFLRLTMNSAMRRAVCIGEPPVKVDYVAKITRGKKAASKLRRPPTSSMTKVKRTTKSTLRRSVCFGNV